MLQTTNPLQRAEEKLPTHPRQFANVCSTRVLFIFVFQKNHQHWCMWGNYFFLCYGLHRVVLRKGSDGKADSCPGGMPVRYPASPRPRGASGCSCQNLLPICSTLKRRNLYVESLHGKLTPSDEQDVLDIQQKVNSKRRVPTLLLTEERAAQPVSNVCSKEEQCMRNRQSRQDGVGGGGVV